MSNPIIFENRDEPSLDPWVELEDFHYFKKKAAAYDADPQIFAEAQAAGFLEHLDKFVAGEEKDFGRYFVLSGEGHGLTHDAFWRGLLTRFPALRITEAPDEPRISLIELFESALGLTVRTDPGADGAPFGVQYEGCVIPDQPEKLIGQLVTGLAMG